MFKIDPALADCVRVQAWHSVVTAFVLAAFGTVWLGGSVQLALLIGCALRRSEAAGLEVCDIQQRDGRWVIPDLRGKHGRLRTVPVPAWVKTALNGWTAAAGISEGRLLRSMNRHGRITAASISPQAILALVREYGARMGMKLQAHDARRTCAKLCRAAGGDLEQIQLLLQGALSAENKVGIKLNVPEGDLDKVVQLIPSITAPTIATLYQSAALKGVKWYSVESVIAENVVRDLIPQLIQNGAVGIIEYPLNKII